MKFDKLQKMLTKKLEDENCFKSLKKEYENKKRKKDPKIIGITGSNGKSTVAYLVHEYLKFLGYKSILYSTAEIDSPASIKVQHEACEVPIYSENCLLNILEEADAYDTDYIVLEVNESSIEKGLVRELEFDVKVLTNLNPRHNIELYDEDEYVEIKKSFFEDMKQGKMVMGLENMSKELFEEFLTLNQQEKLLYSSEYISNVRGVNPNMMSVLLYDFEQRLDGQTIKIKMDGKEYSFDTNLIMTYNILNILGVITTLKALDVLNMNKFMNFIKEQRVPGRAEIIRTNNRTIIIDLNLHPVLEQYNKFKLTNEIKDIKVVIGFTGSGFKTWGKKFHTTKYLNGLEEMRINAMKVLNQYCDYVYLTSNDPGTEDPKIMCQHLKDYLKIPSCINVDRKVAIKQAIKESKPKDLIYITGRGNRRFFCTGENNINFFTDKEVVEAVLKELGWYNG